MTAKEAPSPKGDFPETESPATYDIDPPLPPLATFPETESPRAYQSESPVASDVRGEDIHIEPPIKVQSFSKIEREPDTTVVVANVGDQPTKHDTLGFGPYVEAIASFLTKEVTKPPLTLSIEGEWGSGKSSFMLQLEDALRKRNAKVVRFNAWRYDKDEAMWAAFSLEFARKLSNELPFAQRWWAHLKLFIRRFNWQTGWKEIIRLAFTVAVLLVLITLPLLMKERIIAFVTSTSQLGGLITTGLQTLLGAGGVLAYVALVIGLGLKLRDLIGNPLKINLKQHLDTPDYHSRVAFIEQFHADFAKVVDVYGGGQKVYVFIDDLDRCEVPKAADLMQALNLMISDSSQLIFIMGMDREKVAAGLAVKFEKLLAYLAPAMAKKPDNQKQIDPVVGLEYGYSFIEKFVQLPFLVPQASGDQVDGFLKELFGSKAVPVNSAAPTTAPTAAGQAAEESVVDDSLMVGEILKMVAPTFEYNPRRLKQFINAFRLKTFIASRTGLFDEPSVSGPPFYDQLTTFQLGKFVAIGLRWPLLIADLDNHRQLLRGLEQMALMKATVEQVVQNEQVEDPSFVEALERWNSRAALRALLRFGCYSNGTFDPLVAEPYRLSETNINKLLQVSPESVSKRPTGSSAQAKSPQNLAS